MGCSTCSVVLLVLFFPAISRTVGLGRRVVVTDNAKNQIFLLLAKTLKIIIMELVWYEGS